MCYFNVSNGIGDTGDAFQKAFSVTPILCVLCLFATSNSVVNVLFRGCFSFTFFPFFSLRKFQKSSVNELTYVKYVCIGSKSSQTKNLLKKCFEAGSMKFRSI